MKSETVATIAVCALLCVLISDKDQPVSADYQSTPAVFTTVSLPSDTPAEPAASSPAPQAEAKQEASTANPTVQYEEKTITFQVCDQRGRPCRTVTQTVLVPVDTSVASSSGEVCDKCGKVHPNPVKYQQTTSAATNVCPICGKVHAQPVQSSGTRTFQTASYSPPRQVYYLSPGSHSHSQIVGTYSVGASGRFFSTEAPFWQRGPLRRWFSFPARAAVARRGC